MVVLTVEAAQTELFQARRQGRTIVAFGCRRDVWRVFCNRQEALKAVGLPGYNQAPNEPRLLGLPVIIGRDLTLGHFALDAAEAAEARRLVEAEPKGSLAGDWSELKGAV